jgi:hypothetical protein
MAPKRSTKRMSSLPTLPKVEYYGEIALRLGGKHGYRKVKKLGWGFQGASPKSKTYTGIKKNPREAAIALEEKKFKEKNKREPKMPAPEPLILPNYDPGEPPPTIPSHPIPLPTHASCLLDSQRRRSLRSRWPPATRGGGRSSRPSR